MSLICVIPYASLCPGYYSVQSTRTETNTRHAGGFDDCVCTRSVYPETAACECVRTDANRYVCCDVVHLHRHRFLLLVQDFVACTGVSDGVSLVAGRCSLLVEMLGRCNNILVEMLGPTVCLIAWLSDSCSSLVDMLGLCSS